MDVETVIDLSLDLGEMVHEYLYQDICDPEYETRMGLNPISKFIQIERIYRWNVTSLH